MADQSKIRNLLDQLYGAQTGAYLHAQIVNQLTEYAPRIAAKQLAFDAGDAVLITYADTIRASSHPPTVTPQARQPSATLPMAALRTFADRYLADLFSAIHFLPFFPYSSDDGFSVLDFHRVDPAVGSWQLVEGFGRDYVLMLDFVLNHISAGSRWMRAYLDDQAGFEELAIAVAPDTDLSAVTRPRTTPLLTPFEKSDGETVHLWTTFSADQVDLNYRSPTVLLKMVEVLLDYAAHGARILRMDAVAYLWKQIGTECIHLPETHQMVRLLRAILEAAAPGSVIITETNVPHHENILYFGTDGDEAQMVYNFSLPPLLLHTFVSGDARLLSDWATGLETLPAGNAFFNFTASHDGIGVRPLEGWLPRKDLQILIEAVRANGGRVSSKQNSDGSRSPYELNITYVDALKDPRRQLDPLHVARFLASQAIALSLPGIPGIYIHSLLGSRNWQGGVLRSGRFRSINRERLDLDTTMAELEMAGSFRRQVYQGYRRLMRVRRLQPAFNPDADMQVLDLGKCIFGLERSCAQQRILTLVNVTGAAQSASLGHINWPPPLTDLLSGGEFASERIELLPYQTVWLTKCG
ncbi:MAG: sugar phosphorylase [Desulfosarcinaceae bacterium]|nr:sugar phosphorylase [Desulfosarcinaceae bacterium]